MLRLDGNAVLWFNCHMIRTVPVFFVALCKTSVPTDIIPRRFNGMPCYDTIIVRKL
jgi:hypothetical protein